MALKSTTISTLINKISWSSTSCKAFGVFAATKPLQEVSKEADMSKEASEDMKAAAEEVKGTAEDMRAQANLAAATVIGKGFQGAKKAAEGTQELRGKAKDAAQDAWNSTEKVKDKAGEVIGRSKETVETVKESMNTKNI